MEKMVYGRAPAEKEQQSQEPVKIDRVFELFRFYLSVQLLCLFIFLFEKFNFYLINKKKKKKIEKIIKYKQRRRKYRLAHKLIAR